MAASKTRASFIHALWSADGLLAPRQVQADTLYLDTKESVEAIRHRDLWRTVKGLEFFNEADFADRPKAQQEALRRAVERFQSAAAEIPPKAPPTAKQVERATEELKHVIAALRAIVLPEWREALEELVAQTETWSRRQGWEVKRDNKELSEPVLGTYEAPRLLIHSLDGRFLLDPITRFAGAAEGLVEFCLMPSYDSAAVFRRNGKWYLRPFRGDGKRQRWSEETLRKAVQELLQSA